MATTWIKPLHVSRSMTASSAIAAIIDYANNPLKTEDGKLISSYCCNGYNADETFMAAKREYDKRTEGRRQGRRDVIAYHVRQAFAPGEVDPAEANRIGYELAMSLTKGNHAFICCTHTDKAHCHNHIIFNSTALDCERKFVNFFRSNRAVRRISDLLCAQNGLSIIEHPKPAKGNYGDWLGNDKPQTWKETLKRKIDEVLPQCGSFESFIAAMKTAGYKVNDKRKYISFLAPGQKRPTRMKSLGDDYSEEAIKARLGISRSISGDSGLMSKTKVSLLVDIQTKLEEGKGAGYAQWAKIFNLKEAAKTLIFLKENGIDSYEELRKKSSSASGDFAAINKRLKEIETRQKEITELQKQIGIYSKTREIYAKYKASGWSRDFYDVHAAEIILHRAAKRYFDEHGYGKNRKLPSISQLKQEWAKLASERKTLYGEYRKLKETSRELAIARTNVERLLDIKPDEQNRDDVRNDNHRNAPVL